MWGKADQKRAPGSLADSLWGKEEGVFSVDSGGRRKVYFLWTLGLRVREGISGGNQDFGDFT